MTQYQLPKKWIDYLVNEPESGMGYQIVDIHFKKHSTLKDIIVSNCEIFESKHTKLDLNTIDKIVLKIKP